MGINKKVRKWIKKTVGPYMWGDFDNTSEYGSKEWFDRMFINDSEDRWGMGYRASQIIRHKYCLDMVIPIIHNMDENGKICDIACCLGNFTNLMHKENEKVQIYARDMSEKSINSMRKKYPFINSEVESLPDVSFAEESLNLVTCLEVLYYLSEEDRRLALRNIKGAVKKNGYVLFSGVIDGDERYFESESLIKLIKEFFSIVEIRYLYNKLLDDYEINILRKMQFCLSGGVLIRIYKKRLSSLKRAYRLNKKTKEIYGEKGRTHIFILCSKQ